MDARDKAKAAENRKLRQQKKNLQDARQQFQERFINEQGGWNEPKSLEVLQCLFFTKVTLSFCIDKFYIIIYNKINTFEEVCYDERKQYFWRNHLLDAQR